MHVEMLRFKLLQFRFAFQIDVDVIVITCSWCFLSPSVAYSWIHRTSWIHIWLFHCAL